MSFLFQDIDDHLTAAVVSCGTSQKRILVVDDDEAITREVETILKKNGFLVQKACDGLEAKVFLCSGQYDLVLSDICMPILDGVDLFLFVQETDRVPFILMSGFSDLRKQAEAGEMKFDGLLSKPFGRSDLIRAVDIVFG